MKVVIPARLKKLGLTEAKKDEEEASEKIKSIDIDPEVVEVEDKKEILEPETIDDMEIEEESEKCVSDAKLIDFLHAFLKKQGMETDGEGQEEKDFVEMYHEMVCPECSCQSDDKSVDIDDEEVPEKELEVDDIESSEVIEQLQKTLKENSSLKEELKKLQTDKAVSDTKVNKLNEDLSSFKSIAASAGKKVLEMKSLETKNTELSK